MLYNIFTGLLTIGIANDQPFFLSVLSDSGQTNECNSGAYICESASYSHTKKWDLKKKSERTGKFENTPRFI